MNAWIAQHREALFLALRRMVTSPVSTTLSLLAVGIALALPLGGFILSDTVQQMVRGSGARPQLSLFMKLGAGKSAVSKVADQLAHHTNIEAVKFLPRESTLDDLRKNEELSDVVAALQHNPFPDAFVVTPENADVASIEQLVVELRSLPLVEHVQADAAWVLRMNAILNLGRTALLALSVVLGAGLIAITFNAIRLQMLTRQREIEVSQLLGATDAFVSRPFYYFGVLQGILGGAVAWLIVAAATAGLRAPMAELAHLYGLSASVSLPDLSATAVLLLAAGALGWVGTALSLIQHLRRHPIR